MDFVICQVRGLAGDVDGIFHRNVLQNVQIPQFAADVLRGEPLEETKRVLGILKRDAHGTQK